MPIDEAAGCPYVPPPLEHDRQAWAAEIGKIMLMQEAANISISATQAMSL
jgi:hypothetical protein